MLFIGAVMELPVLGFPGSGEPGPSSQGVFTVSGSGVSLVFVEFFSNVVFTDAPITRRTN